MPWFVQFLLWKLLKQSDFILISLISLNSFSSWSDALAYVVEKVASPWLVRLQSIFNWMFGAVKSQFLNVSGYPAIFRSKYLQRRIIIVIDFSNILIQSIWNFVARNMLINPKFPIQLRLKISALTRHLELVFLREQIQEHLPMWLHFHLSLFIIKLGLVQILIFNWIIQDQSLRNFLLHTLPFHLKFHIIIWLLVLHFTLSFFCYVVELLAIDGWWLGGAM